MPTDANESTFTEEVLECAFLLHQRELNTFITSIIDLRVQKKLEAFGRMQHSFWKDIKAWMTSTHMFASAYNTPEVIEFMITNGADLNARSGRISRMNALHAAAMFNPRPDVMDVLIKAWLAVDIKTEDDLTPLIIAASKNQNLEVVERLLGLGADIEAYDENGKTALALIKSRRDGNGEEYYRISEVFEREIMDTL